MTTAEIQIHGYHKGHQLLGSSVGLSKDDQAVIDRLSDVAGPLRPRELFAPYLSAYPLPSGNFYVVARTWQDLDVPRAGCVRTKSILIDTQTWAINPPLLSALRLLSSLELPNATDAGQVELDDEPEEQLPPAFGFGAPELSEALFLEDAKPVVVFDAPDPELVAVRLLIALWPDLRRRFALSTFALSPRKLGGRDLDLVFAPRNARTKFADWPGRRVDGRSTQPERHRWTRAIIRRVFEEPVPRLLSTRDLALFGDRATGSASDLRLALMWDELLEKLEQTPTAVLGLLDISNSGLVRQSAALAILEPRLAEAAAGVATTLNPNDAWEFVGALARKMHGHQLPIGSVALARLVEELSESAPAGATDILRQRESHDAIAELIPNIADGLSNGPSPIVEDVLADASASIFASLVSESDALAERVVADDRLVAKVGTVLAEVDEPLAKAASKKLLPRLVEDRQLPAAIPIVRKLDSGQIAAHLRRLGGANAYRGALLCSALIKRAYEIDGLSSVRDVLLSSEASAQSIALLAQTMTPSHADVVWLLSEPRLAEATSIKLVKLLLDSADERQLQALFQDSSLADRLVTRLLSANASEVFLHAKVRDSLPISVYVRVIGSVISVVDGTQRLKIAEVALGKCLRCIFGGDEGAIFNMLLDVFGSHLDGSWVVSTALGSDLDASIASRNVVVLEKAPSAARERIVGAIGELANALRARHVDLSEQANEACAVLMLEAAGHSYQELLDAAGMLTPSLLRAHQQPVSPLVAALFPVVYRELARADDVPDFLKFFSFFDWDRCNTARHELVSAFLTSSWRPGDLALTAFRCGDLAKILKRVAKSYGGEQYLDWIDNDLDRFDGELVREVRQVVAGLRVDRRNAT